MTAAFCLLASAAASALPALAAEPTTQVPTYHDRPDRSGNFVVPRLTWARARSLRLDTGFNPRFGGNLYAQPLYWLAPGAASGMLIVATESDTVHAIDASSGATLWSRSLGTPAPLASLPCGNIDPLGITGTPVIDPKSQAVFLDAVIDDQAGMHHQVWGLSLKDGATLPGWPVDVAAAVGGFEALYQNQRGALTIEDGRVYVPYGGHFGDCGPYHGWVVGIGLGNPSDILHWETRAEGGGIWAPGGISSNGHSLFLATGNTLGASRWSDGEAVFRLSPSLADTQNPDDFFAAADWRLLDRRDLDIGGSNPLPLDPLLAGGGTQPLLLALGKDGRAFLLDRRNLGGIGGGLVAARVAARPIITAPAAYPSPNGVLVAFAGHGTACPAGGDNSLLALDIRAGSLPTMRTAWCAAFDGWGSPIVTTTDGGADPIVWVLGAEGDNRLYGFRGDTGARLFASAPVSGLRHFQTLIAAGGRLYVGADGRLYAFSF
ncbi:MAG TPA: PQQ-binding-like beta-propeller repeat protein [Stellaceae bacterium]|nr:PQQ-binding-like beta-propeller repeat protein [Stellaceae bacterium]